MNNTDKLLVNIPFSGFYGTIHNDIIDSEIEMSLCDCNGKYNYDLVHRIYDITNYQNIFREYSRQYVEDLKHILDLNSLEFESLHSPKSYNYTTDRVFSYISDKDILYMYKTVKANNLNRLSDLIKDKFTSYDGFISSYSNDLLEWLEIPILNWDYNQLGVLLEAYAETQNPDLFEDLYVEDSCELVTQELYKEKEFLRLEKIALYLNDRENRKQV